MKSTRLLGSLAAVSLVAWAAGACSSKSDDNGDAGGAGSGTAGSGTGGKASGKGGDNAGGNDTTPGAGANEGGNGSSKGGSGTISNAGDPGMAGETAIGGAGPTCAADTDFMTNKDNCGHCGHACESDCDGGECTPVVVLDPRPRTIPANVTPLEFSNKVLVDGGSVFYFNNGYVTDYQYTILKASVVPATPPADGTPAIFTYKLDASPVQGATYAGGYLYYTLKTGATTAEVQRVKLDSNNAMGPGEKVFTLDGTRIWRSIAITADAAYLTGEVDTDMVDLLKTSIYKIALPQANVTTKPTAVAGLVNFDNVAYGVKVFSGHLFWTQYDHDTTHAFLWTAPIAGGAPVFLEDVTGFQGANIDGDDQYVYWTDHHHGGHLYRCALDKLTSANEAMTNTTTLADADNATDDGMVTDAKYIYMMEDESLVTGKPVWRIPKAGGERELLGELDGGYGIVGLDDGFVYLQDFGDSILYRLPKTP